MKCPYCEAEAQFVTGDVVYPHIPSLWSNDFYFCDNGHERCYVGCHKGTTKPLGRLANAALRSDRSKAHAAFDPIWKQKLITRSQAYAWLAEQLNIKVKDCHIAEFDRVTCRKVTELSLAFDILKYTPPRVERVKCGCGGGFASHADHLCKYCRESKYSRAQAKSVNVRHRGDGMSLDQEAVLLGTKKRSEVFI